MDSEFHLRLITLKDAKATLDIYAPYVQQTAVSFEYDVPSLQEWERRINAYTKDCPWLVCEHRGRIIGYAYASKHRDRTAYAWSADAAIYLSETFHGRGVAAALYETLFVLLKLQGYVNVLAGITIPNNKSENFHLKMGFQEVGIYRKIGYKFGTWHDTRWLQHVLAEHPSNPEKPKSFLDVQNTTELRSIIQNANAALNRK